MAERNDMNTNPKIFVAGHNGMVGSAICRTLKRLGFESVITKTKNELDLTDQQQVRQFFEEERPSQVYLAAAKVGGIHANLRTMTTRLARILFSDIVNWN